MTLTIETIEDIRRALITRGSVLTDAQANALCDLAAQGLRRERVIDRAIELQGGVASTTTSELPKETKLVVSQPPEREGMKQQLASDIAEAETEPYAPHITEHGEKSQAPFLTAEQLFGKHTAPAEAVKMDGWKLVPLEPTVQMMNAGGNAIMSDERPTKAVYKAMLAAAPERGEGA